MLCPKQNKCRWIYNVLSSGPRCTVQPFMSTTVYYELIFKNVLQFVDILSSLRTLTRNSKILELPWSWGINSCVCSISSPVFEQLFLLDRLVCRVPQSYLRYQSCAKETVLLKLRIAQGKIYGQPDRPTTTNGTQLDCSELKKFAAEYQSN